LFVPAFPPAFGRIGPARRELGFRTVFNMMGPLLNPAHARYRVMGVYAPELTETAARVLSELGVSRAYVVHGHDGVDEISLTTTTRVTELRDGWTKTWTLDPADYGFEPCDAAALKGGDAAENAAIAERVLSGERGPKRDVVILNAAAAIAVSALAPDFASAVAMAKESIDSGAAARLLARLRAPRTAAPA
ncbi:MAG: anthranilate phosphoribosyltransferase, partial [Spirochaetota bacterium]